MKVQSGSDMIMGRKIRALTKNNVDFTVSSHIFVIVSSPGSMSQHNSSITLTLDAATIRCPITLRIFARPVVAEDGNTYEESAIRQWFAMSSKILPLSPMTGEPMGRHLVRNMTLESIIDQHFERGKFYLL